MHDVPFPVVPLKNVGALHMSRVEAAFAVL